MQLGYEDQSLSFQSGLRVIGYGLKKACRQQAWSPSNNMEMWDDTTFSKNRGPASTTQTSLRRSSMAP